MISLARFIGDLHTGQIGQLVRGTPEYREFQTARIAEGAVAASPALALRAQPSPARPPAKGHR
jgi:hypothetical protein